MLPWILEIDDNQLDAVLYAVEGSEYQCDSEDKDECHPAPYSIGTSDTHEPRYCFKHYFEGCQGDGSTDYKLVFKQLS